MPYEEGRSWPAAAKGGGGVKVQGSGCDLPCPGCFSSSFHLTLAQSLPCPDRIVSSSVSVVALFTNLFLHHAGITCSTCTWSGSRTDEPVVSCVLKEENLPPPVFIHNSHFLYSTFKYGLNGKWLPGGGGGAFLTLIGANYRAQIKRWTVKEWLLKGNQRLFRMWMSNKR